MNGNEKKREDLIDILKRETEVIDTAQSQRKKKNKERYDALADGKKHPFKWFFQGVWYRSWFFIIGGILLTTLISACIVQSVHKTRYDLQAVMAYVNTEVTNPYWITLEGEIGTVFPDVNGDGEVNVQLELLNLGEATSVELSEANWRKMLTAFNDDQYVMFIVDEYLKELYSGTAEGETPFDSTLIQMYTGKDELFLSLEDSIYFKDSEYTGDKAFYIAFRPKPSSVKASDEIYYKDYLPILRLLLPDAEAK